MTHDSGGQRWTQGPHVAVPGITRVIPAFRGGLSEADLSWDAVGGQDLVTSVLLAPVFIQAIES